MEQTNDLLIGVFCCLLGLALSGYSIIKVKSAKEKELELVQDFILGMQRLNIDTEDILDEVKHMTHQELKVAIKRLNKSLVKYNL